MKTTLGLPILAGAALISFMPLHEQRPGMTTHSGLASEGRRDSAVVRLTVVYDNNPLIPGLQTAWGFSCFVELGGSGVLFDTGGEGDILLANMAKLKIAPANVDKVVISHVHMDHLGGLSDFLQKNSRPTVCVPATFPPAVCRDIQAVGATLIRASSHEELGPRVFTVGIFGGSIPEQALVLRTGRGLVVMTGCAHPGVVNLVRGAKSNFPNEQVYLVIGGFHLRGMQSSEIITVIESLKGLGVQKVAPCHCSGDAARALFKKAYGDNYIEVGVGAKIDIPLSVVESTQEER